MKRLLLFTSILSCVIVPAAYGVIPCESYQMLEPLVVEGANPGRLSPDGLSFFCGLSNVEESGEREMLYEWKRAGLDEPWQGPFVLKGKINKLKDSTDNMQPTISGDGLILVFVRNATDSWGDNDLWLATRSSPNTPFNKIRAIGELNTPGPEAYPFLTSDAGRLYYITDDGLMVAEYSRKKGGFMNVELMELPEEINPMSSWLSTDGLEFVVSDGRSLYHSRRSSLKEPFAEPEKMELPEGLGFIAAPSFDPPGSLYLYESCESYGDYQEEWTRDDVYEEYPEEEDVIEDTEPIYDYSSTTRIVVLGCTGGQ